jgi:phosphoglycolate phosphatase
MAAGHATIRLRFPYACAIAPGMTDFPFPIVGFDLDGTLVDSHRDLAPALNHALGVAGRPPVAPEEVREFVGGGTRLMLTRALDHTGGALLEAEFEAALGELLAHYEAHIADHTVPYPGCLAALDALAERGCRLAVLTNKLEVFSRLLLDALGMTDRFEVILGGDTLGPGRAKPAPDMIDTAILTLGGGPFAMVGDSSFDVRAAKNARVPVVAVSFGYNDLPAEELGADAVIDHYDELVGALERL